MESFFDRPSPEKRSYEGAFSSGADENQDGIDFLGTKLMKTEEMNSSSHDDSSEIDVVNDINIGIKQEEINKPKSEDIKPPVETDTTNVKSEFPSVSGSGSTTSQSSGTEPAPSSSLGSSKDSPPKKPQLQKSKSEDIDDSHKNRKDKQEEERNKLQVLVSNFSEEQLNRYEMFRRAAFTKAAVRRIMQSISGSAISPNVIIAMSGIAKVYAGEIMEQALDTKEKWKDTGPVQPRHLREAVRLLKNNGTIKINKHKKKAF